MTARQRGLSIVIGLIGAVGSCLALGGFLLRVKGNSLELPDAPTVQAFYRSMGAAYTGGFVAGFSLCFFLTLLAVALGTWFEARRSVKAAPTESVRMSLVGKPPRG